MKLPIIMSVVAIAVSGTVAAHNRPFIKKNDPARVNTLIDPAKDRNKVRKAANLPAGTVLYEDFEEWDGITEDWQPEGWTYDHKKVEVGHQLWKVYPYDSYDPIEYPSNTYIFMSFTEPIDEWLISPSFEIAEGMVFQADIHNAGSYYFDIVSDMFTSVIQSIEKANDFKVLISTDDGATWTELHSEADTMLGQGYTKAYEYWDCNGWHTVTVPLDEYYGKTAKIAFQIVGNPVGMNTDNPSSNASGVDNIMVGYPSLDVKYGRPDSALYMGITHPDTYLPGTFMVVPVNSPVTYPNLSADINGVSFEWSYEDTDGKGTSNSAEGLTLTYRTDPTSEETLRNNIYDMPVLKGSKELFSTTSFQLPGFVQAGGKGEYGAIITDDDGNVTATYFDFGLANADPFLEGTRTYAAIETPYFGYNNENDRYWTIYKFNEKRFDYDPNDTQNWMHLERIGNLYYTSEAPIVIDGIRLPAFGLGPGMNGTFGKNVQLKAEIYLLDKDMNIPATPAYTAICGQKDIQMYDRYATNYILTCNFKFPEPVVLSSADCPAYMVAVTGFRDPDNIEYFSPEMSSFDNPNGLNLGWYQTRTCWGGVELPLSWETVYSHTSQGDHTRGEAELEGERRITFFIQMDGAYPWLEAETDEIKEVFYDTDLNIPLNSYFDASRLSVEGCPAWLNATVSGRYGNTKLTLRANAETKEGAEIEVKGPGVSKKFKVGNSISGIEAIGDDTAEGPAEYFNLQGLKVEHPQPGQLLIKRQGNKSVKVII